MRIVIFSTKDADMPLKTTTTTTTIRTGKRKEGGREREELTIPYEGSSQEEKNKIW